MEGNVICTHTTHAGTYQASLQKAEFAFNTDEHFMHLKDFDALPSALNSIS